MPKRSRGTGRPGQRSPLQRSSRPPGSGTTPSTGGRPIEAIGSSVPAMPSVPRTRPAGTLTDEEEERAAQLEAQILAEERAAHEAQRRTRDRARTSELAGPRARDAAPLAVAAANEYAYVRRDIVRIGRVGAVLLAVLLVLYVAINVLGLIRI